MNEIILESEDGRSRRLIDEEGYVHHSQDGSEWQRFERRPLVDQVSRESFVSFMVARLGYRMVSGQFPPRVVEGEPEPEAVNPSENQPGDSGEPAR